MVVGPALPLIDVDDAVQIREVAVQIHALSVAPSHKPVLDLSRLRRGNRKKGLENVQRHKLMQLNTIVNICTNHVPIAYHTTLASL